MTNQALHTPVLLTEAIQYLNIQPHAWYIDATFGRGGHTQAILAKQGKIIALDVDQEAIAYGQEKFADQIAKGSLILIKSNFANLHSVITKLQAQHPEITQINGILFDFGTSLDQIRSPKRGFSFDLPDSPLDMRMDQELGVTASDLLTFLSVKQLTNLFKNVGGELRARKIATAIDRYRGQDRAKRIETVGQLIQVGFNDVSRTSHLHPATKVFQALRIAVNDELNSIEQALPQAYQLLASTGRLVTIAFHQGEDSLVKQQFKYWVNNNQGELLTLKPVTPTKEEIINNPAARSAKLRAFKK